MATLKQVVDVLETLYPLRYAEQWDEPGLIVGDLRHDVRNIAFAADPSMAVIDQAIAGGIDLLICHHPLFFRSIHPIPDIPILQGWRYIHTRHSFLPSNAYYPYILCQALG